jgi:hypothetical protein
MKIKQLLMANNQAIAWNRFLTNTQFSDHLHNGPELVSLLKGSARVDDKCILAEWLCATKTGTLREPFKVKCWLNIHSRQYN